MKKQFGSIVFASSHPARRFLLILVCLGALLLPGLLPAQEQIADSTLLTVDRIFHSSEFAAKRFGPMKWLDSGNRYTTIEKSERVENGRDIVQYDCKSGNRKVMVSAEELIPPGHQKPLRIANYAWSKDHSKVLIFTNTRRVWRVNTRGDYWVLDRKTGKLEQLGRDFAEASLMFAKFSPDGQRVAYVYKNNIYVEELADHTITQLTWDGSDKIINGTFDWVYEEEFRLRDGFRWSPDGKHIAFWQLDTHGVPIFYMINNTDSLYPKLIPIPYPKAGQRNAACRIGVVSVTGGYPVWINVPGDPRNHYIAQMDWLPNSNELIIQQLNRYQNTDKVFIGNALTGEAKPIFVEKDEAWVDVLPDIRWLKGEKEFLWVSERDGWRHVYRVSRDGKKMIKVTPGDYDVMEISGVDERKGILYFIGSLHKPTERYLYSISLNGKGKPKQVSPAQFAGTHSYNISPNGQWAIHTYSTMEQPPVINLVRLPKHNIVRTLLTNNRLRKKVNALKRLPTEFFRVDIGDGIVLDGYQIKPPDFDPAKKYPVLFYVYGEPWGQTVWNRWGGSGYLWHLMLAQKGYIVMSIDNRGTPVPRGRQWRKCIYKKIGVIASADQAAALEKIKQWPYVDGNRIGIWGWSGGGSMTLNMMFRYPDLYKVGMAVAPVPDIHLYDTIYQERYMGLPQENPEEYDQSSPITFAHQLKGDLLIVHGTGDDNVHYQGTEKLINKLIEYNKQFWMMAYPNRSHGIYEGKNTTRHLRTLLTNFLLRHLPAGGR